MDMPVVHHGPMAAIKDANRFGSPRRLVPYFHRNAFWSAPQSHLDGLVIRGECVAILSLRGDEIIFDWHNTPVDEGSGLEEERRLEEEEESEDQ